MLLVHGSAADRTTWTIQLAGLRSKLRLIAYDRRGTGASPLPQGAEFLTVEAHADDAAKLIETHNEGRPVVAIGSSFGGVVVLDLARRRPELLKGAMILEPPLAENDEEPPIPEDFLFKYDAIARTTGGTDAAEYFLRSVLGDGAYEKMPKKFQERSKALHAQIRQDIAALGAYPVRYSELASVKVPILLLGGEKSAPFYRRALYALEVSLGNAMLETLSGAGHMMHADAHRRFNQRVLDFVAEVSTAAA